MVLLLLEFVEKEKGKGMLSDKIYNLKVGTCSCTQFFFCLPVSQVPPREMGWCCRSGLIDVCSTLCPFFPLVFITCKRHLTILSVHGGDAIELKVTFYLMYKLKNKKEKEKNTLIEDGNSSCSNCDKPWLLFPVYRMSRLWWGKNAVSLVLPDNWSCFVLIELLFFSVAEVAASGSIGL